MATWKIKNGELPYLDEFPEMHMLGAFCHATNLNSVTIPSTVQSIGRYSFTHTVLTAVTLPDACTYYSTSFPEGCTVTGGILNAE